MSKKRAKAWLAVADFLDHKTTDNFLAIIRALRNGSLLDADREKLLKIDPSDLKLMDYQYPDFERKFINALLELRFDVDFGKIGKYIEKREKNTVESTGLTNDTDRSIISEKTQQAIIDYVKSGTNQASKNAETLQRNDLPAGELFPFFETPIAILSDVFDKEAIVPLLDCAREVCSFYNARLFIQEDYYSYEESKSKKELRWIIVVFQAIATRYLAEAEKPEDHSQITHLVLFVSFNLNLLYTLHYPESNLPVHNFETKLIEECEAYKQESGSLIKLLPYCLQTWLYSWTENSDADHCLHLIPIAFQALQGEHDCQSEITLVISRALTESHETELGPEGYIYHALRRFCAIDALQEISSSENLMKVIENQIGYFELSDELSTSLDWGIKKYRRRVEECIRDVHPWYFEEDEEEVLERLWLRLMNIYEEIGLLDDPDNMEFGFASKTDSSYFSPPSTICPNLITAGYLFINYRFENGDAYPDVDNYFNSVDAFQNSGMLGYATKIFCFSLFHIFTCSEHSFDRKLRLFRKIEYYFEKLEKVSLRRYLPIFLYTISLYEKAGMFEKEPLAVLWLNDVSERFPLENGVAQTEKQSEEYIHPWYQKLLEDGVGSIKSEHIKSLAKLRALFNEKNSERYQILYENLRISDALTAYLNSIQSILYDIFDESFQILGRGELSAEFSALREFAGEREVSYLNEVNWEWIIHLNNVLRRSKVKRGPEFQNFIETVARKNGDNLSRFLCWLASEDLNISIRTLQRQRNANAHRRSTDKSLIPFPVVSLIDSFFRIDLGVIVKESNFLDSTKSLNLP
jgi:hypothetical protein